MPVPAGIAGWARGDQRSRAQQPVLPSPRGSPSPGAARGRGQAPRPCCRLSVRPSVCPAGATSGARLRARAEDWSQCWARGRSCTRASALPLSASDLHRGGRLGPSPRSRSLGRQRAAEAALGTSPPALNGTFVGEPGGSPGLPGTRSAPVPGLWCQQRPALPGVLQRGWGTGAVPPRGPAAPTWGFCWKPSLNWCVLPGRGVSQSRGLCGAVWGSLSGVPSLPTPWGPRGAPAHPTAAPFPCVPGGEAGILTDGRWYLLLFRRRPPYLSPIGTGLRR